MEDLGHLALATLAFVGGHFLLASPSIRALLIARLGDKKFSALFSASAAVGMAWMVFAFRDAPFVPLWETPPWAKAVPALVMPWATFLFVGSLTGPNPTAVGQRLVDYRGDPAWGVLKITRHPMMWAFGLWALAHLAINGEAAALILFGGLAILALGGTLAIDHKRRLRDPEGFARLAAATSNVPFAAIVQGRAKLPLREIGWWRVALAIALYFLLIVAHPLISGRDLMPAEPISDVSRQAAGAMRSA